ncbi:MAG: YidC/Oxa1 family membrane protein insertase [Bacillota bacterium]
MFGFFGGFIDLMTQIIEFIYQLPFVSSYGLAIIIFTLAIKFALFPLTAKQTRSMKAMQDLQPKMEKIKEKYEDNKEKQQEEMMKLYQENNVNPVAGCLPMILQLFILIPLYRAILAMSETFGETAFLWIGRITDGSLAEPDIALVIITGLVMVAQTKVTQSISGGGGGKSGMMMWIMPIMIVFIGFQLPSGIMVYWLTSTLFSVIQQYLLSKETDTEAEAA